MNQTSQPIALLIEDDQWLAESYRDSLLPLCEVKMVTSARDAIELIDNQQFDVVVADVMLEDGLVVDLLHELQSYQDTMNLPIILCTSLASTLAVDDLRAYGVRTVLDKATVTPETLRIAVQQALHESSA